MTVPNEMVQARVEASIKHRASLVLERMGMTISEAIRILLTRTANEGRLPFSMPQTSSSEHDAWFRKQVEEGLHDTRPGLPHSQVKAETSGRIAAAKQRGY